MNGQNFMIEVDGKLTRMGFFKNLSVKADTPEAAELKAVDIVRDHISTDVEVHNSKDDPPVIYMDEIWSLGWFRRIKAPRGATWYPDDEESD